MSKCNKGHNLKRQKWVEEPDCNSITQGNHTVDCRWAFGNFCRIMQDGNIG
jgi:hypothetical protein